MSQCVANLNDFLFRCGIKSFLSIHLIGVSSHNSEPRKDLEGKGKKKNFLLFFSPANTGARFQSSSPNIDDERERYKSLVAPFHFRRLSYRLNYRAKLYIPSTLNIDLILWHTELIVWAEIVKPWFKSWVFPFTFNAYFLPHTLNCMCVSLFKFHI